MKQKPFKIGDKVSIGPWRTRSRSTPLVVTDVFNDPNVVSCWFPFQGYAAILDVKQLRHKR